MYTAVLIIAFNPIFGLPNITLDELSPPVQSATECLDVLASAIDNLGGPADNVQFHVSCVPVEEI